jgi:hypothetical protein
MKRKSLAGLIAIVAVIAVAMFAGCVEEEEPTPTPAPKAVVATPTPTHVLTYQDSKYADWSMDTNNRISTDLDLLKRAANRFDFESIGVYSEMLYDDAKKGLDEIDQFYVSPAFTQSKNEFKLSLQDFKQAGYYGEMGGRNHDTADISTCADYMESAGRHLLRATDLIPEYTDWKG